jgi:hypothetical protein
MFMACVYVDLSYLHDLDHCIYTILCKDAGLFKFKSIAKLHFDMPDKVSELLSTT